MMAIDFCLLLRSVARRQILSFFFSERHTWRKEVIEGIIIGYHSVASDAYWIREEKVYVKL